MGGCKNRFEALFLKMLGRLPVDVLILDPDRSAAFALEDKLLYQMNFTETLHLQRFPQENTEVRMGTAAYHAERELDTLMYQDSGLYRNQQYQRADIINLQTMYEEMQLVERRMKCRQLQYDGKHGQYPGHFCKSFRRKRRKSIRVLVIDPGADHRRYHGD